MCLGGQDRHARGCRCVVGHPDARCSDRNALWAGPTKNPGCDVSRHREDVKTPHLAVVLDPIRIAILPFPLVAALMRSPGRGQGGGPCGGPLRARPDEARLSSVLRQLGRSRVTARLVDGLSCQLEGERAGPLTYRLRVALRSPRRSLFAFQACSGGPVARRREGEHDCHGSYRPPSSARIELGPVEPRANRSHGVPPSVVTVPALMRGCNLMTRLTVDRFRYRPSVRVPNPCAVDFRRSRAVSGPLD